MPTSVLIVGAGIIGTALADRLAPHSTVTLLDASEPGSGTTATSLAWINANSPQPSTYHALRTEALRPWDRLSAEFGRPTWYQPTGNLTWSNTGDDLANRVAALAAAGYPAQLLTRDAARKTEPHLDLPPAATVAHFPLEGHIHGQEAAQALAGRAVERGAHLVRGTGAELITSGTAVTGVRLDNGTTVTADITVCAAGWRTPDLLATIGTTLPVHDPRVPGSTTQCMVAATTPTSRRLVRGVVHGPDLYMRHSLTGGLVLEARDTDTATDHTTTQAELDERAGELLARARSRLPELEDVRIHKARRCIRPMPLDGLPLTGQIRPGLYTAFTHSGITLAALLADLISNDLLHGTDSLADYRPSRASG
ncbi:FAD-binding oxidoreductase [Actinocorallia sp. API 0066]|uniref:NAD(P)/FAD-dependent oxidoreductase n=1 Tax=Actinocorallia sp. API 0066 TaxID=2896846 RepID=UPI001E2A7224|nr:FAD-binding oxidoreductase [Actinocorallia sp. API 0066]MCD0449458.1 FAD-binding oxidoreductase [Actinocorallia sp. API 0066]